MRRSRRGLGWAALVAALFAFALAPALAQPYDPRDFKREMFKMRFQREMQFRVAALQVAWSAERMCQATTEIEPFVLWSLGSVGRTLSREDEALLSEVTSMDANWRVAWLDEAAPDELRIGDVVTAVNGRPLPTGGSRFDMTAILRGASPVAGDDQGYREVMALARAEALVGQPMTITLADGRRLKVETQTGCAGTVFASGFDHEPDRFWRQGSQRTKIPANAMLEARSRDEFRWLAAFGTFFQATEHALARAREADGVGNAFAVGKILALAIPGATMLLSVLEQQADRLLAVDSVVGGADLFANEVVTAMGGDPSAGHRLNERFARLGLAVDTLGMTPVRLANAQEHAGRLTRLQAAAARAQEGAAQAPQSAPAGASGPSPATVGVR